MDASHLTRCDVPDELMREMRSGDLPGPFWAAWERRPLHPQRRAGPRPSTCIWRPSAPWGPGLRAGSALHCTGAPDWRGYRASIPVGATENAMLAAAAADGTTTITNAAREPEIVDLQNFLLGHGREDPGRGQLGDHH